MYLYNNKTNVNENVILYIADNQYFKFCCFLTGMLKLSAIIILTYVHHQDSFETLWRTKRISGLLGLFHDPFGGILQTSSKPMRLRRRPFCYPNSPKRASLVRITKNPTMYRRVLRTSGGD